MYSTTDVDFAIVGEDARRIYGKIGKKIGIRKVDDFTFEEINLGGPHVHYFGCNKCRKNPVTIVLTEKKMPTYMAKVDKNMIRKKFNDFYGQIPAPQKGLIGKIKRVEAKIMSDGMKYGSEVMGYDVNMTNVMLASGAIVVLYVLLKGAKSVGKVALYLALIGGIYYGLHKKGVV